MEGLYPFFCAVFPIICKRNSALLVLRQHTEGSVISELVHHREAGCLDGEENGGAGGEVGGEGEGRNERAACRAGLSQLEHRHIPTQHQHCNPDDLITNETDRNAMSSICVG